MTNYTDKVIRHLSDLANEYDSKGDHKTWLKILNFRDEMPPEALHRLGEIIQGKGVEKREVKSFCLHWQSGHTEIIKGRDIEEAMRISGYGGGAVNALDSYEIVPA